MSIDFKADLNPQQFDGVQATEGPVLVLAGAGSGKTRMLTYKIAYLVHEFGVDPFTILAVTFTNKAANEMRERVEFLLGCDLSRAWMGTFHSICGRMLRRDGDVIGLKQDYIIYDADDSVNLIKEVVLEFGLDPKQIDCRKLASAISKIKCKLRTPNDFEASASTPAEKTLAKIYFRYDELLRKANAVDFDDMIVLAVRMLMRDEDVRLKYCEHFQYILVDEFQDTNESQFALLRQLTQAHHNITVVGDDDQSIYSWRGAQVRNILEFPHHYPGCKIIKLEKNYRSTGHILEAASGVIAQNTMRHEKQLFTDAPLGKKVFLARFSDDYAEAEFAVAQIRKFMDSGIAAGDMAVLYRINALSRVFEQKLMENDIPYIVVGGLGFYERAEIKDILAYLRIIMNPADDVAFRRIVNKPRRGIGASSVAKIAEIASDSDMSFFEIVASGLPLPLVKRSLDAVRKFVELIQTYSEIIDIKPTSEIIEDIMDRTKYLQMLVEEGDLKAQTRIENLGQLVSAAQDFENDNPDPTVYNFLSSVTLMTGVDRWKKSDETVNLMTVHAAKGLEFKVIFAVGLELGIFPLARALIENSELEEERRLFYVALTRSQKHAFVTYALQRGRFGSVEEMAQSPFLRELPQKSVEFMDFTRADSVSSLDSCRKIPEYIERHRSRKYGWAAKGGGTKNSAKFAKGMKVIHPFFGDGHIIEIRGSGDSAIITVNFRSSGKKKLVAGFAKLKVKS